MENKIEKILTRIQNLFDLANNNPNENEALSAALKAQELMMKYNIEISQLEDVEFQAREIFQEESQPIQKWARYLAVTIAENFRCKCWFRNWTHSQKTALFYGYKEDAKIATETFNFLVSIGNKLAQREYYSRYKNGLPTKGIKNTYLYGFYLGIKEELERQSTALMAIVPKEVETRFVEKKQELGLRERSSSLRISQNENVLEKGKRDGRNAIKQRSLA